MISVGGHNYSSMAITRASVKQDMDVFIQRLSSGRRINSAKDDVGGVQISSRLNAEIKGLEQASKNAADAQSLIDTASVAIKEAKQNVLRIRELAVQAANGTLSSAERAAINLEVKQNIYSIDSIASNTAWGGKTLLDGSFSNMQIQTGSKANGILSMSISSISSTELGFSTTATTSSSSSTSTHPGANNSTDVSIIANHPTNSSHPYFIKFTDDTTAGMIHWYSNGGGIDPTDDPNSKVEILGKEYTIPQGTIAAKTNNLQTQLAADGISATVRNVGIWEIFLEVDAATLDDYITAYGTTSFVFYADPLNVVDGDSNDGDLTSSGAVQLVAGNNTSTTITTTTPYSLLTADDAETFLSKADTAIAKLNTEEGKMGALSNRIDKIISANFSLSTNLNQATAGIIDADYASETAKLAKNNILQQVTIQMSALARNSGESLRILLKGDSFLNKQNFLY